MAERLGKVPLERALSKLGMLSRSKTREAILAGKLKVNGKVVKDPWFPVTPEVDHLELEGVKAAASQWRTVLVYKPRGVVTTTSDEQGRQTIYDVLSPELKGLHPVGRLDMASTGLLILTNDTRLSDFLTDPQNAIPRTYVVSMEGEFTPDEAQACRDGIMDEGELLKPSKLEVIKASGRESHVIVELTEGKNRELRRLFGVFLHRVRKLKRISFGPFLLGEMQSGQVIDISKQEIEKYFPGVIRKDRA